MSTIPGRYGGYGVRPPRPGSASRMVEQLRRHLGETWLAWMRGFADNDVFHDKVHRPVFLIEFDMHKGVFLHNDEPEKFHIHLQG